MRPPESPSCTRGRRVANYIPHYTKKKQGLKRLETRLAKLLREGAKEAVLSRAAVAVRDARVRVLRAQRDRIAPEGKNADLIADFNTRIERAQEKEASLILAEFVADTPA